MKQVTRQMVATEVSLPCNCPPLFQPFDQRRCAFVGKKFSSDNWQCCLVQRLRELIDPWSNAAGFGLWDVRVNNQHPKLRYVIQGDQRVCLIDLDDDHGCEISSDLGLCMYVTWYKERGATDNIVVLGESTARLATEHDVRQAIRWLESSLEIER